MRDHGDSQVSMCLRFLLALALSLLVTPAPAQWQVPNHATPQGRGSGITGFRSFGPCLTNIPFVGGGASADAGCWTGNALGSAPSASTDIPNKTYVDALATGLHVLASSTYATAAVLPNTPTYANGASGVGATLTAGSNTTLTVDGTVAALNDVVLVKNQASTFQNGIYKVTTVGSGAAAWVLTRVTYFDQAAEMLSGSYTFITSGTTNSGSSWTLLNTVGTVGTDALTFNLFTAGVSFIPGPISEYSPTRVPTNLRLPLSEASVIYINGTGAPQTCGTTGSLSCGIGSSTPTNPFDPATPFDTLTNALTYWAANIDSRGFAPTFNLSHGNHTQQFTCQSNPLLGQVTFVVAGDYTSPTAANLIAPNGERALLIRDGCTPSVSSIKISDQGSSLGAAIVGQGGILDFRSTTFGNFGNGTAMLAATEHGHINMLGADSANSVSITNTLSGTSYGQVFQGQYGGYINFAGQTVAIPNAITIHGAGFAFFNGFAMVAAATSGTFTGAGVAGTTGPRCIWVNSFSGAIDPNTIFPGNANCTPVNNTF